MPARVLTYKKGTAVVKIQKQKTESKQDDHMLFVKEVMHECLGFAPYERHILEFLRLNRDRQALRYANKRMGKIHCAKVKIAELTAFK